MSDSLFMQLTDETVKEVDRLILSRISTPVDLLNRACMHLIAAGGKRIRPRLMILAAGLLSPDAARDPGILSLAAAVEILHTATLMHDDVIDDGAMRRGKASVNRTFGNRVAVLGGDYMFTRVYDVTREINDQAVSRVFSDALATLVRGEISQMSNIANPEITEKNYFETIYSKTSVLFEISARLPALLLRRTPEEAEALATYGRNTGFAFQIADDILDYTAGSAELGKNPGRDLDEQKITLPLIYAIRNDRGIPAGEVTGAVLLRDTDRIVELIGATGALGKCDETAGRLIAEALAALDVFPDSPCREGLRELARKAYDRTR